MRKRLMLASAASALAVALAVTTALAAIVGTTGAVVEVPPPPSVVEGAYESDTEIRVFEEVQGLTLTKKLKVDITEPGIYSGKHKLTRGKIPAGTLVNSYYLHFDPVADHEDEDDDHEDGDDDHENDDHEDEDDDHKHKHGPAIVAEGSVTFDEEIIGIVVKGNNLKKTDRILGASGTEYPKRAGRRGPELRGKHGHDVVTLHADRKTVTVHFTARRLTDDIRIITRAESNPVILNNLLRLDGLETDLLPSPGVGPVGDMFPGGIFTITSTFSNISGQHLTDLYFKVVVLTGEGNLVLNADGGPGGVGSIVSVPDEALGDDGILSPDESFIQDFLIGLQEAVPFDFFTDAYGFVIEIYGSAH